MLLPLCMLRTAMHVMLVPFNGAQLPQRGFLGYGLAEGVHPWRTMSKRGAWPLEPGCEGRA